MAQAAGARQPWLESAELTYWKPRTQPVDGVQTVSHANTHDAAGFTVLGIRYPHPDGAEGRARVELVVAESPKEASGSWLGRFSRTLDETLPGMSWGAGIRQAKALDIPLSELEAMLQGTREIMLTSAASRAPRTSNLIAEVNGRRTTDRVAPLETFEKLTQRVAGEGRLISYHGTAEELHRRLGSRPAVELAKRETLPATRPVSHQR